LTTDRQTAKAGCAPHSRANLKGSIRSHVEARYYA
jgi:hypothetical protein